MQTGPTEAITIFLKATRKDVFRFVVGGDAKQVIDLRAVGKKGDVGMAIVDALERPRRGARSRAVPSGKWERRLPIAPRLSNSETNSGLAMPYS